MCFFIFYHLLLIFINISRTISHQCGIDKLKIKPRTMKLIPKIKKNLIGSKVNSNSFSPIKIGYDFTTLEKPYTMNEATFSNVKSILKETREEFSKILQVVHQDFDLSNLKNDVMKLCDLNKIGKDYPNFLIKNDLLL